MRGVRAGVAGLVFGLVGLVLALIVGAELDLDRWGLAGVALVAMAAVGGGVMMGLRVLRSHRTAEASGVARVGFWPRAVARLVDEAVVIAGVVFLAMPVLGGVQEYLTAVPEPFQAGHASVSLAYWTILHARARQTVGKLLVGAVVVDASTLAPVGYPRAAARLVATVVSLLPFGLGFLWAAWDPDRQTFHDKIARTVVVKKADLAQRAGEPRRRRPCSIRASHGSVTVQTRQP